MATVLYTKTEADGWTQVAGATDDFLLENKTATPLHVTLQASSPDADAPYHVILGREAFVRIGDGIAFVRVGHPTRTGQFVVTT